MVNVAGAKVPPVEGLTIVIRAEPAPPMIEFLSTRAV
jgi:hypothetical protein